MAKLDEQSGSIVANCPGCRGGKSTFEWRSNKGVLGAIEFETVDGIWKSCVASHRLYRCAGCGRGAFGIVHYGGGQGGYPGSYSRLIRFYPDVTERLKLPKDTPEGIRREFEEAEECLDHGCLRAAAGLLRSVLDKTLRANGYKPKRESLEVQIDIACADGVITESRRRRAHDEVRVLGNDVLHDEWHEIPEEDVLAARHYCQRILEDFYDIRVQVEALLIAKGRLSPPNPVP